jgi:iron complex transport system permease protein
MTLTYRRLLIILSLLSLLLVASSLVSLSTGSIRIAPAQILEILTHPATGSHRSGMEELRTILLEIRLPRILLAITVGMALSVAGASFQALLRNPLADPHVLGVSSGAALGAILSIYFRSHATVSTPVASFLGALITIAAVYYLGGQGKGHSSHSLLLAGIITSSFLSALIIFLQTSLSGQQLQQVTFWLLGDFSTVGVPYLGAIFFLVVICTFLILLASGDLNVLLSGEIEAQHLGVNVRRVKRGVYLLAALLTGLAVSISGSIGYVGLLVPHIVRMAFGSDYRLLIPATALAGAAFAVTADIVARTVVAPAELPIGAVTALTGAPVFIYLLRKGRE